MVIKKVDLVFNDTPSMYNKDLTEFIKRNLETIIIKGQIKFNFIIAKSADLKKFRSMGIKRLPALILQRDDHVIGVPNIIEYVQNLVKKSKKFAKPKTENEVLNDYFQEVLGDIKQDDSGKLIIPEEDEDEFYDNSKKLMNSFQSEISRRNESLNPKEKRSPPKPSRNHIRDNLNENRGNNLLDEDVETPINNMSINSQDDTMMNALLERLGVESI